MSWSGSQRRTSHTMNNQHQRQNGKKSVWQKLLVLINQLSTWLCTLTVLSHQYRSPSVSHQDYTSHQQTSAKTDRNRLDYFNYQLICQSSSLRAQGLNKEKKTILNHLLILYSDQIFNFHRHNSKMKLTITWNEPSYFLACRLKIRSIPPKHLYSMKLQQGGS